MLLQRVRADIVTGGSKRWPLNDLGHFWLGYIVTVQLVGEVAANWVA